MNAVFRKTAYLSTLSALTVAAVIGAGCGLRKSKASGTLEGAFVDTVPDTSHMILSFSKRLLEFSAQRGIDQTSGINQWMLGAHVWGNARQIGHTELELRPHNHQAFLDTVYYATTTSSFTGWSDPATFWGSSQSPSGSRKVAILDDSGLRTMAAATNVSTHIRYHGVEVDRLLFRGIARNRAWQQLHAQKGQAESIMAGQLAREINARLDAEVEPSLRSGGIDELLAKKRSLETETGLEGRVHFSTLPSALRIQVERAPGAAETRAPGLPETTDLGVEVHQDLLNALLAKAFAGKSYSQEEFDREFDKLFLAFMGQENGEDPAPGETGPFKIKFADENPITLDIADGSVKLVIRGEKFKSANKTYELPMDITLTYEAADAGDRLTKSADVRVVPPDYDGGSLTIKQQILAGVLKKHFKEHGPEELAPPEVTPPGALAGYGRLRLHQSLAEGGWLSLSWQKQSPEEVSE